MVSGKPLRCSNHYSADTALSALYIVRQQNRCTTAPTALAQSDPSFSLQAKSLCSFNDLLCSIVANFRALLSAVLEWGKCVEVEDQMSVVENQFSKQLNLAALEEATALSLDSLQREVADKIHSSYRETFDNVREVGKNKIEFLEGLKLAC